MSKRFDTIYQNNRDLGAVFRSQCFVIIDIHDQNSDWEIQEARTHTFNGVLGVLAEVAIRARVDLNANRCDGSPPSCLASMAARLKHPEKFRGGVHVTPDLLAKKLGRVEPALVSYPAQKLETRASGVSRHGRFEDKRLDGEEVAIKRRSHANVSNRIHKPSAIQRDSTDVDTISRKQFIVGVQVQGWDGNGSPAPFSGDDAALDFKPAPE
jgi:hypothetical protein